MWVQRGKTVALKSKAEQNIAGDMREESINGHD
jgi:hypothetical protein